MAGFKLYVDADSEIFYSGDTYISPDFSSANETIDFQDKPIEKLRINISDTKAIENVSVHEVRNLWGMTYPFEYELTNNNLSFEIALNNDYFPIENDRSLYIALSFSVDGESKGGLYYLTNFGEEQSQTTPIEITCETEGADIRYTLDGSDPTEESTLYSGQFEVTPPVTIKARGYKEGMLASDVASYEVEAPPVLTVPMALPDGSVLFYDRGESYGSYHLNSEGYPERDDGAEDDGSATSANWRYLICDSANLSERIQWGPYGTNEGMTDTKYEDFGYGLPNTEAMLSKYSGNSSYIWQVVQNKRNATGGKKWFVPSKDELDTVYENKVTIVNAGGGSFPTDYVYWSSSEYDGGYVWYQFFANGLQGNYYYGKNYANYCRLLRRI